VPFAETEVRILNKEKKETSIGEKGVLYVKGPQVMKGYYKNIEKTEEILSKDGWLDTGDFAVRTENGDIIIVGRAKDTIVLLGGENVDPEPIEEKIKDIVYIDNAVVLGQDKKALEALITLNSEYISKLANELKIKVEDIVKDGEEIITHSAVIKFLKEKMNSLIAPKHGFKRYEKITKLTVLNKKFEKGEELTQTLKIKRKFIEEKYKDLIEKVGKVFKKRK
jgi:long-chain acyl-CoA synthetase